MGPVLFQPNGKLNRLLEIFLNSESTYPDELAATVKHVIENEAIDGTTIEVTGGVTYGARARAK